MGFGTLDLVDRGGRLRAKVSLVIAAEVARMLLVDSRRSETAVLDVDESHCL